MSMLLYTCWAVVAEAFKQYLYHIVKKKSFIIKNNSLCTVITDEQKKESIIFLLMLLSKFLSILTYFAH